MKAHLPLVVQADLEVELMELILLVESDVMLLQILVVAVVVKEIIMVIVQVINLVMVDQVEFYLKNQQLIF
jgi:hypothetical protein